MMWAVLAFSSAVLSAAAAVAQKRVLFRIQALEFSFLVSVLTALLSCGILLTVDVTVMDRSTLLIIGGKSLIGGTAFLLVMNALRQNQISTALPLLGMTPAVTALVAFAALGESLRPLEWGGVMLMIAGTYLLEKPDREALPAAGGMFHFQRSHVSIYGAVLLFAVSSVADRMLLGGMKIDARIVLFYQNLIYCALFGGMLLRKGSLVRIRVAGKEQYALIALIAFLTFAYRFLQLEATTLAPVALVLAVKRMSILLATFFGGRLFVDDRLTVKMTGASLIVASGFLILRNVG